MLRYRIITIIFLLGLFICLILPYSNVLRIALIIFVLIAYVAVVIWGVLNISSQFFVKTICNNNKNKDAVAITFDDGPDDKTLKILDVLSKYKAQASFFFIGSKLEKYKDIAEKVHKNNHIIGNHSYFHTSKFPIQYKNTIKKEIEKTQGCIKEITGKDNIYFRPPYGVTNPRIARALKGFGLDVIGWSIRSFDTVLKNKEDTLKRVLSKIKGGDIILLHDTTIGIEWILKEILEHLKQNGYKAVTIKELIKTN